MPSLLHRRPVVLAALCVALLQAPAAAQTGVQPLLAEARQAVAAGQMIDALAAHARAIAAAPDDPVVHASRAQLFLSLDHPDLAARDYRAAARLSPGDASLQSNLCLSLALARHDLEGALAACNAAVRIGGPAADALATRGYVHLRRDDYGLAAQDFAAALELNPASPGEMVGLGIAMIHTGRAQQGRDIIASATLDDASIINAWQTRGFGMRGEVRPDPPLTTASQPILRLTDRKIFTNTGSEAYFGIAIADGCGRVLPRVSAAALGAAMLEHSSLHWSGDCRFGLIHGEGQLSAGETPEGPVRHFVYGRELAANDPAALRLKLAYQPVEAALAP